MNYWMYILPFVGMWYLQIILSKKQTKHYLENIKELRKIGIGHLGVGIVRAKFNFGKGIILIVVTDEDGKILEYRKMEGGTVFAKLKKYPQYFGIPANQILHSLKTKKEQQAFTEAIKLINNERAKNNLTIIM
jgi:glucitol operon activator protein